MKRLALLPLIFLLNQCGEKLTAEEIAAKGDYQDLPPIPEQPKMPTRNPSNEDGSKEDLPVFGETPVSSQTTPCSYWNSLSYEGGPAFRILSGLQVKTVKVNNVDTPIVHGKHIVSELPQVQFLVSQEYADSLLEKSESVSSSAYSKKAAECKDPEAEPGKSPLDPPDIEAFMAMAKEKHDCGEVSDLEYSGLQLLYAASKYNSSAKKTLLETRNEKVIDEIEKQLPGVFRGQPVPLTKSKLMAEFMKAANITKLDPTQIESLRPLEKRVSLFVDGDWNAQRRDLEQTMRILDITSADPSALSLEEQACRFALSQRATSQMLVTKGMNGAPQTQSSGLLVPFEVKDVTLYPKQNQIGKFGLVVDRPWVLSQLDNPTARIDNLQDTESFLHALRYLVTWTRYRSSEMWTPIGTTLAEPGKLQIPVDLLELGFGLFGISAKIMANEELIVGEDRSIHLKQDSARNLAILAVLALDVQDTYKNLTRPTPLERDLLGPDKIKEFTDPYPVGVVARFQLLTSGIVFEGLKRIHEGETSPELKEALRAIGRRIGNPVLANLE
jgi:hypothetical protein